MPMPISHGYAAAATWAAQLNARMAELVGHVHLPDDHDPEEESHVTEQPTVVCLCGSTRFREAFEKAMRDETLAGKIVLTVGLFGHLEGLDMDGPVKVMLDNLHLRKIDRASEVLFLNVGGYLGASSRRELEYARAHGKVVRFLEPDRAV